ncbi:prepilin-type N-terminal cleavage/methylation domain-containing protein [Candidatus Gracilibacteria bacterium]|nr:prepilin-type N-terminal cleavage/methylation domain-containing protein [Candidatus Gracilibacteria bacterium]
MMQRVRGFSIIEILTTLVVAAIIASIAAPQYGRIRQENDFNDEAKDILHSISSARANAIAHKKCGNDEATLWGAEIGINEFKLFCNDVLEVEATTITTLGSVVSYNDDIEDVGNTLRIVFIPETLQSKVIDIDGETETPKEKVKISLSHIHADNQKTICFHSISGFPTLTTGDVGCPE